MVKGKGYEESVITEQIDKTRKQDRVTLQDKANGKHYQNGDGRVPFIITTIQP